MKQIILTVFLLLIISCKKDILVIDIKLPETSVVSSNSRWGVC